MCLFTASSFAQYWKENMRKQLYFSPQDMPEQLSPRKPLPIWIPSSARPSCSTGCAAGCSDQSQGHALETIRAVRERVKGPVCRPPSGASPRPVGERMTVSTQQLRQVERRVVGRAVLPAQLGGHLVDLGPAHATCAL
jgi:hypothetical protein